MTVRCLQTVVVQAQGGIARRWQCLQPKVADWAEVASRLTRVERTGSQAWRSKFRVGTESEALHVAMPQCSPKRAEPPT